MQAGEKSVAERGEERTSAVGEAVGLPSYPSSYRGTRAALRALSSDTLPHHVLRAGGVKQASLYSGFIQHQSSSLLFFRRY